MQGEELGKAIKARLDRLGWSQYGFARLVNATGVAKLSPGYLSQLINGKVDSVGSRKLQAFAQVFGIGIDDLLDLSIPERPDTPYDLPGTADLPPVLGDVLRRVGRRLSPRAWEALAVMAEALADPPEGAAHAQQIPDPED